MHPQMLQTGTLQGTCAVLVAAARPEGFPDAFLGMARRSTRQDLSGREQRAHDLASLREIHACDVVTRHGAADYSCLTLV